ncbi:hypothetical protein CDL15_Pgr017959 [Punica granatum]|uniref:Uncharacterized protein n=1 Tax=Punica granatum TaxID=22663 RepID=A0A218WHB5_PUNGR|nr:hypothetical protein CDL15_Pgr017959 [Punica granatum]
MELLELGAYLEMPEDGSVYNCEHMTVGSVAEDKPVGPNSKPVELGTAWGAKRTSELPAG